MSTTDIPSVEFPQIETGRSADPAFPEAIVVVYLLPDAPGKDTLLVGSDCTLSGIEQKLGRGFLVIFETNQDSGMNLDLVVLDAGSTPSADHEDLGQYTASGGRVLRLFRLT